MHGERAVTAVLSGGLGNQMFQYAAARALALRLNALLELDISFYTKGRHRTFDLQPFPIKAGISPHQSVLQKLIGKWTSRASPVFGESSYAYDPRFETITEPMRLEGYFQSPKYFAACNDTVCRELTPPLPVDQPTLDLGAQMAAQSSISLHVRRGDYVSNAKAAAVFPVCSPAYYHDALARLPQGLPVFVFTDDLVWAKANLTFNRPTIFSGERAEATALGDLWLMSKATHHVIANSTFSWWGAWLKSGSGLTIAPKPWFHPGPQTDRDLISPEWLRVGIEGGQPA